jgi:polysaccharide biosynthesis protein VpsM
MNPKPNRRYLLAAAAGLTATQLHAFDPDTVLLYNKGPLLVRPQLQLSETFTDNVLYNNAVKKSDFITTFSPGMVLQVGKKDENYVIFDYIYDHLLYARTSGLDSDNHHFNLRHHVQLGQFTLEGRDTYEQLSGILGSGFALNQGIRVDRDVYWIDHTLKYDITEKTDVYGRILYDATDYGKQFPLFDQNEWIATGGFEFKALPKTSFFGELYYGQTATDPNTFAAPVAKPPHSDFVGGFIGARGEFTSKLTGTAKAGYESRDFSDHTGGISAPVVEISLAQRFTERNILSLVYSRRSRVSVEVAKSAYTADVFSLTYRQALGAAERWKGDATLSYGRYEYEPSLPFYASRSDEMFTVGLGISYDVRKWLTVRGAYDFQHFDTSLPTAIDYDVNRVILTLAIGY